MNSLVLKRMRLCNFGPFQHIHELVLDRGPTCWFVAGSNKTDPQLGPNGAGKTTLFTALYWGLTGRTLRNGRPADRIESWNGGTGSGTFVEVEFACNNVERQLLRSRRPNRLQLDGTTVTDADVLRLLGVSPEVMLHTFVFGQHNELFMDLRPEAQSALFTELLDLDVWPAAAERAGKAAKTAEITALQYQRAVDTTSGVLNELDMHIKKSEQSAEAWNISNKQEIKELEARAADLKQQFDLMKQTVAALPPPPSAAALQKEYDEIQRNFSAWQAKGRDASTEAIRLEREVVKLNSTLTRLDEEPKCPTCGQKLPKDDATATKAHINKELAVLRDRLQQVDAQKKDAYNEAAEWEKDLIPARKALNEFDKTAAAATEARRAAERKLNDLDNQFEITSLSLYALNTAQNPYIKQVREGLARRADIVSELKSAKENLVSAQQKCDYARLWQDAFRAIRLEIIEGALLEVAAAANRHAERLGLFGWQIEFATERQTKSGSVSLGFTTAIWPPGQNTPIPWDSYSGGESTRWQLAVSFGLGEVLLARAGIVPNIEIFDEPTKGLSPEGISDLMQCLSERARELGKTVYLVDHHAVDRGSFDGVLLVEKGASGSRIIEE